MVENNRHVAGSFRAESFHDPSETLPGGRYLTFAEVEEALIEAAALWRRSPPVGHARLRAFWPETRGFNALGDYDAGGGDRVAPEPRPLPLTRDEVARRDLVSSWLELVPIEINRRIVGLAVMQRAAGRSQIDWGRVLARVRPSLGRARGKGGLRKRYERAITAICVALENGGGV